jgi:hypothetical protein
MKKMQKQQQCVHLLCAALAAYVLDISEVTFPP